MKQAGEAEKIVGEAVKQADAELGGSFEKEKRESKEPHTDSCLLGCPGNFC